VYQTHDRINVLYYIISLSNLNHHIIYPQQIILLIILRTLKEMYERDNFSKILSSAVFFCQRYVGIFPVKIIAKGKILN